MVMKWLALQNNAFGLKFSIRLGDLLERMESGSPDSIFLARILNFRVFYGLNIDPVLIKVISIFLFNRFPHEISHACCHLP